MTPFAGLLERWRTDATVLRRHGLEREADALAQRAQELDAAVTAWAAESLTLEQAAQESGLSYSALEKAVRRGRLANAGSKGAPRVRRADLPRKARGPEGIAALVLAGRR